MGPSIHAPGGLRIFLSKMKMISDSSQILQTSKADIQSKNYKKNLILKNYIQILIHSTLTVFINEKQSNLIHIQFLIDVHVDVELK